MKQITDFFCDPVKIIKNAATVTVCVAVMLYAWFQIMSGVSSDVETEPAFFAELYETVDASGYIFRDETPVTKGSGGTVVTVVSDSQRVSKGQKLASVYSDGDNALLQDDINRLQRKLDILDKSAVESDYLVSDIEKVDEDILDTLNEIYESSSKGDLSMAINHGGDFLVKLNKHNLIVSSEKSYDSEKSQLEAEKQALQSRINSVSTSVYASSSGYYYGDVDGYENAFLPSLLENMTLSEFEKITDSESDESLISASAGKIVNDFVWYVACSVASSDMAGIEEGNYYRLCFPESGDREIKMLLWRVVRENSSAQALAIFRCNVIPEDFDYQRAQPVKIVLGKCEGLAVPKKALRVIDGIKGVYILVGDVVHFRRVEIIDESEDYYIVSNNEEDYYVFEDDKETPITGLPEALSLYDNVVVAGKDLFDGKIVG